MTLTVSPANRHLLQSDGKPFFYLADTAWELFHRLNLEDATHYLKTRAAQKFTVIQAVLLAEFDGLHTPNPQGHLPLLDDDPTKPLEGYFQDCDAIIRKANELHLTMALLPTWGDKFNKAWGKGPEIFTPDNARIYGSFLGRRYRDADVIWVLGGDRPLATEAHLHIVRAMAQGIREASPHQLMTFHPPGGESSSAFVHDEAWLDFNMIQSGHRGHDAPTWHHVADDLKKQPPKPTLDGEPNYEDHPVMNAAFKPTGPWFDDFDCRKQAWRALLSGTCGHTYGCHDVWQMWDETRKPINFARTPWRQAIELSGATQMQHVQTFVKSIDWLKLVPDATWVRSGLGDTPATLGVAARAADGSWYALYVPTKRTLELDLKELTAPTAAWFDPRTAGRTNLPLTASMTPPSDDDWVLLVHR